MRRVTGNTLYVSVLLARCCSLCLPQQCVYPCRTLLLPLSTAVICLFLLHAVSLFVYRGYMSVLVSRYCYLCLPRLYVCPCCTLLLSLFNDARQGKQQCARRTTFDLLKKKFNFLHTRFSRTKHT